MRVLVGWAAAVEVPPLGAAVRSMPCLAWPELASPRCTLPCMHTLPPFRHILMAAAAAALAARPSIMRGSWSAILLMFWRLHAYLILAGACFQNLMLFNNGTAIRHFNQPGGGSCEPGHDTCRYISVPQQVQSHGNGLIGRCPCMVSVVQGMPCETQLHAHAAQIRPACRTTFVARG